MTGSIKEASRDGQTAVENLVTQYRIERAARWMGKIALVILAATVVASVISLFGPPLREG